MLGGPVETRNDGFGIDGDLLTSAIEEAIARPKAETAQV